MNAITINTDIPPVYRTLHDVYCMNGGWFSSANMRFFGTRVLEATFTAMPNGDAMFVTSDYTGFDRTRRGYTVRHASWSVVPGGNAGEMNTVAGGVGAYATRAAAVKALRAAAADILARASTPAPVAA